MKLHRVNGRRGFTLVELLVVIGIIALLISILLPSLAKARRAASSIKCMANLRSIVQAMQIYAAQNNGAIAGSPWTTAQFIYTSGGIESETPQPPYAVLTNSANYPTVCSVFDWMTPLARIQGIKFTDAEETATDPGRVLRFLRVVNLPIYTCPDNAFLATPFGTPAIPTSPMVSYCAAGGFLVTNNSKASPPATSFTTGSKFANPPQGYNVRTSKVGSASKKIYVADGGKYSKVSQTPTVGLSFTTAMESSIAADVGAYSAFSNSWDRGAATTNLAVSGHSPKTVDSRIYAYRHGRLTPFGPTGTYRMNAGFFDGHCESLTDMESANPVFWYPKGSILNLNSDATFDVKKFYFNGSAPASYRVPE